MAILAAVTRSAIGLRREAHARRCVLLVGIPLQLLACITEESSSEPAAPAASALADAATPTVDDTKTEDASESPLSTSPTDTPTDGATAAASDDSDESLSDDESVSSSEDSGTLGPAPLSGCQPELPAEPDAESGECDGVNEGNYACSQGHAYLCTWADDEDGAYCWEHAPNVTCPLWTENQCEAALEELRTDQPCKTDTDCTLWGGLTESGACNVARGEPPLGVSLLLPPAERDALRSAYEALLSRGCVESWGSDGTPHEAHCSAGGQCETWQESCLGFFDERRDAGLEVGTLAPDASVRDVSAPDASVRDASVRDVSVQVP